MWFREIGEDYFIQYKKTPRRVGLGNGGSICLIRTPLSFSFEDERLFLRRVIGDRLLLFVWMSSCFISSFGFSSSDILAEQKEEEKAESQIMSVTNTNYLN